MLKPVDIIDVTDNANPKFVKTQLVTYERDGVQRPWEMIKSHDSVHVMVYNLTTREFLLVKQVRVPVLFNNPDTDGAVVEACAGLVDKDTSIIQIAKEEILEELGYDVPLKQIEFVKELKSSVGTAGTSSHTFVATVTEDQKVSEGGGLDGEDIEVIRVNIDKVQDFIFAPTTLTDAVTMFLVNYYYSMLIDE